MQAIGRWPQTALDAAPFHYERRCAVQTTLYRQVQQHATCFVAQTEAGTAVEQPQFIKDEFDAFLNCRILAHGLPHRRRSATVRALRLLKRRH